MTNDERSPDLEPWKVRAAIYSQFLSSGRSPSVAQLSQELGATRSEIQETFSILAWDQQVVLQSNGELLAAPPFSALPTPFEVDFGASSPAWGFGICCALGIAATAGRAARVRTQCGHCRRSLAIEIGGRTCTGPDEVVAQFVVPPERAPEDIVSACSTQLLFCDPRHAEAWREGARQPEGEVLSLEQAWRLAAVWHEKDRRDRYWRRRTVFEANAVFDALGLRANFWRLTPPHRRLARSWPDGLSVFRVFADEARAGGTPALVVERVDGLDDSGLRRMARHWAGESTCVYRASEVPRLRFFVPGGEIADSGHGTLAAAVLLADGASERRVRFAVGAREIRVDVRRDRGVFAELSAQREPLETIGSAAQRCARSALGLGSDVWSGWPAVTVGSARRTTLLPLSSTAALHAILTSKARVRRACEMLHCAGLYPFVVTDGDVVEARHFPADSSAVEDAATAAAAIALGSASGARYPLSRNASIRIRQGTAMGEPSDLFLREEPGGGLRIGGRVVRVNRALSGLDVGISPPAE